MAAEKPNLCFLDVGSSWDSAVALLNDLSATNPSMPVVAISSGNDPDIILRSLRQGASEFLFQPFAMEQVGVALDRLMRHKLDANEHMGDLGKVYCVMPGKGACGATTVALNLAFQLQRRTPDKKVLLADLDPATGTLSFLLKLKSTYSFVDALSHASQMDEDLWKALVSSQQNVDVLLCPENPVETIAIQEAAAMIGYAKENYEAVILDVASPYGEWVEQIAKLCDDLVVVTTNELPALHSTQKTLAHLESIGIDGPKIKLLVNRYDSNLGLDRDAIETALNLDVFHVLPNDSDAIQKSLLEGKPVAANTALGKNFAIVAENLGGGRKPVEKRSSLLSGIFSVFDGVISKG